MPQRASERHWHSPAARARRPTQTRICKLKVTRVEFGLAGDAPHDLHFDGLAQ